MPDEPSAAVMAAAEMGNFSFNEFSIQNWFYFVILAVFALIFLCMHPMQYMQCKEEAKTIESTIERRDYIAVCKLFLAFLSILELISIGFAIYMIFYAFT